MALAPNSKRPQKSGSSILMVMMGFLIIGMIAQAVPGFIKSINYQRNMAKTKALYTQIETRLRYELMERGNYSDCPLSCTLRPEAIDRIQQQLTLPVIGSKCGASMCRIYLSSLSQQGGRIAFSIKSSDPKLRIKAVERSIPVTKFDAVGDMLICNDWRLPVLTGYRIGPGGYMIAECKALPRPCAQFEVMVTAKSRDLTPECKYITQSWGSSSCDQGSFLTTLSWNKHLDAKVKCQKRENPPGF